MVVHQAVRYYRTPTRQRVQLFWISAFVTAFGWQVANVLGGRVQPRRNEFDLHEINEKFPDGNVPPELLKAATAMREFREAAALNTLLQTPSVGESTAAMSRDLDMRQLGKLRRE